MNSVRKNQHLDHFLVVSVAWFRFPPGLGHPFSLGAKFAAQLGITSTAGDLQPNTQVETPCANKTLQNRKVKTNFFAVWYMGKHS